MILLVIISFVLLLVGSIFIDSVKIDKTIRESLMMSIGVTLIYFGGVSLGAKVFKDCYTEEGNVSLEERGDQSQNHLSAHECWEIQAQGDTLLLVPKM